MKREKANGERMREMERNEFNDLHTLSLSPCVYPLQRFMIIDGDGEQTEDQIRLRY